MDGPKAPPLTIFRGTLVHAPVYGEIEVLHDRLLVVKDGKIDRIAPGEQVAAVLDSYGIPAQLGLGAIRRLGEGEFLMPGLIDTHVHAPQVGPVVVALTARHYSCVSICTTGWAWCGLVSPLSQKAFAFACTKSPLAAS